MLPAYAALQPDKITGFGLKQIHLLEVYIHLLEPQYIGLNICFCSWFDYKSIKTVFARKSRLKKKFFIQK